MQGIAQDLRYGLRMLLKTPGVTAAAVLALGLGIGANTAIFTVVSAVLVRPLPYPDPDRIVAVFENKLDRGIRRQLVSPLDYKTYAQQNQVFDGIAAIRNQPLVLTGRDLAERIDAASVSPSIFQFLGMRPSLGRAFAADEDLPQKNGIVVLSDGLWRRRFGADPNILDSKLILDGRSYSVIGVAPPGFRLVDSPSELWIPYTPDPQDLTPSHQGLHILRVLAHLKAGVSASQAASAMEAIAQRLADANPNTNAGYSVELIPLREQMVGNIVRTLWTLMGAVGFVLLIACANVANLLLAKASARQKEIAVRSSLGASARRIVRQMLTESVLLALIGGILGLALAYWGTAALVEHAPADTPRLKEISLDWRVLAFTLLVSIAAGLLFGLAPALASGRRDLNRALGGSVRGSTATEGRSRIRDAIVISEIACCVALSTGAGLLIRSFMSLEQVNPGFRPNHVLTMQFSLPPAQYSGLKIAQFYKQLLERVQALPGVQSAGVCRYLPLSGPDVSLNFYIEGQPRLALADQPRAKFRAASPGYFAALGIPLVRGRLLDASDGEQTPKVVVLNEAAARRYWPGQDPIGKRIIAGEGTEWSTVVGVIANVKHAGLDEETSPETYYHYLQIPPVIISVAEGTMFLAIRTSVEPAALMPSVRNELRTLDPNQPVFNVRTMDEVLDASLAQPRFRMILLGLFAALALVLVAIGLYGVMAYSVAQRTNELGVRIALGAEPAHIGKLVMMDSLRMAVIGVGVGLAIAAGTSWIISKLLFGIRSMDALSFAAACLVTIVVTLLASFLPAIRAIRIAPAIALRAE